MNIRLCRKLRLRHRYESKFVRGGAGGKSLRAKHAGKQAKPASFPRSGNLLPPAPPIKPPSMQRPHEKLKLRAAWKQTLQTALSTVTVKSINTEHIAKYLCAFLYKPHARSVSIILLCSLLRNMTFFSFQKPKKLTANYRVLL